MVKKILIIFLVLFIVIFFGITYLNKVILPIKIKSLIISSLQEATQKKVDLQNLEFNILKGLVLKNLTLSDGAKQYLIIKEASCTFLILPVFKKKIVIPSLSVDSAVIFLQRREDNTFNLQDLFFQRTPQEPKTKFKIFVYKVNIKNSRLNFQDDALSPVFIKDIDNLNLTISISLPVSVKFILKAKIPDKPDIKINASGEFRISDKQLTAQVNIKDFSPREFLIYYQDLGFSIPEGSIDSLINLNFKDDILDADLTAQGQDLAFSKDKIVLKLNSDMQAKLRYSLKERKIGFSGKADIVKADITGLGPVGDIADIKGELEFNDSGLSTNNLSANVLGIPVQTKFNLVDFSAPRIRLELLSKDLSLESIFVCKDKLITISQCNGQYLNSRFLLQGDMNIRAVPRLESDISGKLGINLKDIKGFFKNFQPQLERINPAGIVDAKFNIKGNLKDFKFCAADVILSSASISAYGLKSNDFLLNYNQSDGRAEIRRMYLSLYDGAIEAVANMNLNSENLPYWISANIQGVKIEKLKLDTPLKEKDISGTIQAETKINGFSGDLSKLNGAGKIFISEGKLWQLNLFKGLGALLFSKDFANIIFSEGNCGFVIQDKYIFSDNLELKSNAVNLSGPCKIGFDGSINASVNIKVLDELTPLSGTFKDITTAILGEAGRFGVIKISGTLTEPKYKFQPVIADIIKGLKDAFLGNP